MCVRSNPDKENRAPALESVRTLATTMCRSMATTAMKLAAKGYSLRQRVRQKLCPKIVDDDRDTFLRGIRPFVILGQMFGIFPIYGVTRNDPERFRLKWFSLRVILNLTVVVTALLQAYYEYGRLKTIGINAKNVSSLIFFIDACLINVLFLNLATKWRSVAMKWDEVDDTFNRPPYHMQGWSLRKRLGVVSFTLVFLAAVEHILSIVSNVHNQMVEIKYCNWTEPNYFQHYSLRRFANIYLNFPYNSLSAVFFTYVSSALTMYWNYQDIFIIMISIGLATRFQQINNYLKILSDGVLIPGEDFWIRVRTNYVAVCELLDDVDRAISWTMLISCATNLYYICLQILHVSKKLANTVEDAYYGFSLGFLIVRTVIVFLSAAHIHDCAKKPLDIIMKIPNVGWCVELERFSTQLKSEKVALSGMGFFSLTRQLLFSMAGTIVTYELVMLKFDQESESKGNIPLCTKFRRLEHVSV
uniref:Gustatory receptor n=1 Tax=Anopheles merus TaxID=30066 RepID=A0A3F2Z0D4_ANOME